MLAVNALNKNTVKYCHSEKKITISGTFYLLYLIFIYVCNLKIQLRAEETQEKGYLTSGTQNV